MPADNVPLTPGAILTVDTGAERRDVCIERVDGGLVWIATDTIDTHTVTSLAIEVAVPGDARYRVGAQIAIALDGRWGLRPGAPWEREQHREFARVTTYGLRADITHEVSDERLHGLPVIDLSAGGIRIAESTALAAGDLVICRMTLTKGPELHLAARVVRVDEGETVRRRFVALEFLGVPEEVRSELIAWVNREQLRRQTEVASLASGRR